MVPRRARVTTNHTHTLKQAGARQVQDRGCSDGRIQEKGFCGMCGFCGVWKGRVRGPRAPPAAPRMNHMHMCMHMCMHMHMSCACTCACACAYVHVHAHDMHMCPPQCHTHQRSGATADRRDREDMHTCVRHNVTHIRGATADRRDREARRERLR